MATIDTLLMTKKAEKTIPFGVAPTYIAHIKVYTPPPPFRALIQRGKNEFNCWVNPAFSSVLISIPWWSEAL